MSDIAGWVLREVERNPRDSVRDLAQRTGVDTMTIRRARDSLAALVPSTPLNRPPSPRRRGNRQRGT